MSTKTIRLADIVPESIVDGVGLRCVLFSQGCKHACKGCFNPQTHSFDGGHLFDADEIIDKYIRKNPLIKGITFSGGDPFEQAEAFAYIAKKAKELDINIWSFTGYTFETIIKAANTYRPEWAQLISYLDVIVDGKFVQELHDPLLRFRGSSNQRIIDVKRTLMSGTIIEYREKEYLVNVG